MHTFGHDSISIRFRQRGGLPTLHCRHVLDEEAIGFRYGPHKHVLSIGPGSMINLPCSSQHLTLSNRDA